MKNKLLTIFLLILFFSFLLPHHQINGQNEDEKFTTIGPIGISNKYIMPEDKRTIKFRIKNNTSRTIKHLFGWVFMIYKKQTDPGKRFLLINNPHKSGITAKGKPHLPGTISEWSFILARKPLILNQNIGFTLQIHPRSIFFANIEPPQKNKENPGNP